MELWAGVVSSRYLGGDGLIVTLLDPRKLYAASYYLAGCVCAKIGLRETSRNWWWSSAVLGAALSD